jgi:hypothetical protein
MCMLFRSPEDNANGLPHPVALWQLTSGLNIFPMSNFYASRVGADLFGYGSHSHSSGVKCGELEPAAFTAVGAGAREGEAGPYRAEAVRAAAA